MTAQPFFMLWEMDAKNAACAGELKRSANEKAAELAAN
jgi:hypothetical protein